MGTRGSSMPLGEASCSMQLGLPGGRQRDENLR